MPSSETHRFAISRLGWLSLSDQPLAHVGDGGAVEWHPSLVEHYDTARRYFPQLVSMARYQADKLQYRLDTMDTH